MSRQSESDASVDDVVFLGAGASKPDGAPTQCELLHDYFSLSQNGSMNAERRRRLSAFFNHFFDIDTSGDTLPDKERFPSFEEVLGIIELALVKHQAFKPTPSQDAPDRTYHPFGSDLLQLRDDLVLAIAETLARKLRTPGEYHNALIESLAKPSLDNKLEIDRTGFISLNYDILLDNALLRMGKRELDYGFPLSNGSLKAYENRGTTRIYKLHGSLNWLYCSQCNEVSHTGMQKGAARLAFEGGLVCDCGGHLSPVVVPPTFFKDLSDFRLQAAWSAAEVMLREAKRLFICGYSLPDADIQVKYLLKRAEMNRPDTQEGLEVFVVNNHVDKDEATKKTEKARFRRLFKSPLCYTNLRFEEFSGGELDSLVNRSRVRRR